MFDNPSGVSDCNNENQVAKSETRREAGLGAVCGTVSKHCMAQCVDVSVEQEHLLQIVKEALPERTRRDRLVVT